MSNIVVAQAAKLASTLGIQAAGEELVNTLKATAFKGPANDSQMAALLIVANQDGLSPWTKEIYAFPDRNNGIVPVVGVDGWSRIINQHPQFDGMDFEHTRQLIEEVVGTSDKLGLSVYDIDQDAGLAQQYKVDKTPGIVIAGRDGDQILDYGIRYSGIPSGHEFSSLINTLVVVSYRDSGLDQQTRDFLSKLDKPVHLQVFVTPT